MSKKSKAMKKHVKEVLTARFKSGYDMAMSMDRIVECVNELREVEEDIAEIGYKIATGEYEEKKYAQKLIELEVEATRWKEWMMQESKELHRKSWSEEAPPYSTRRKIAYACHVTPKVKGL